MSGVLALLAAEGRAPFLANRTIALSGAEFHFLFLSYSQQGLFRYGHSVSSLTSPGVGEWYGRATTSNVGSQYSIRLTVLSGSAASFEGSPANTWISLASGVNYLMDSNGTSNSGVWRIEIRRDSSGVVVASADYTLSVTCTSGC